MMTTKHEIEIPGLPAGWKPVAYQPVKPGEFVLHTGVVEQSLCGSRTAYLIVEEIKPKRIILEATGEVRQPVTGEYVHNNGNLCLCRKPERWGREHEIWREVKEDA